MKYSINSETAKQQEETEDFIHKILVSMAVSSCILFVGLIVGFVFTIKTTLASTSVNLSRLNNIIIKDGIGKVENPVWPKILYFKQDSSRVELRNGTKRQNEVLNYAWKISKNKDFLCTILGENIQLTHDRKHDYNHQLCWTWKAWETKHVPNQEWCWKQDDYFVRIHTDWGFGISDGYYRWIVEDERFTSDWKWNLEQTFSLWRGGTRFYGRQNCWFTKQEIIFNL